jgi:hypothetical protein
MQWIKWILVAGFLVIWTQGQSVNDEKTGEDRPNGNNVFIITLDGFRWQEVFSGADKKIMNDPDYTADASLAKKLFWDENKEQRREKLMPFFWNVIAHEGAIFGNRELGSKVNTKNIYSISYPGYNEIFTGTTDPFVSSNKKIRNKNVNLLEYLNHVPQYAGKIAAFTSWNLFPFILNAERSKLYINSGYSNDQMKDLTRTQEALQLLKQNPELEHKTTRNDMLTFLTAKDYIVKNLPKVVYIALGGTDESGHDKNYAQYLKEANQADRIIRELWNFTQQSPFYRNNTTFIITTDHGRGNSRNTWYKHGFFVSGSSQTWIAMIGNGIKAVGEYAGNSQLYQKHIAGTVGYLLGVTSYRNEIMPSTFFEKRSEPIAKLR